MTESIPRRPSPRSLPELFSENAGSRFFSPERDARDNKELSSGLHSELLLEDLDWNAGEKQQFVQKDVGGPGRNPALRTPPRSPGQANPALRSPSESSPASRKNSHYDREQEPQSPQGTRSRGGSNAQTRERGKSGSQSKSGVEYSATGSNRVLRCAKDTNVKNLAGSIAWISRDGECPEILCSSALAINQGVKAMAIARNYLAGDKIDYYVYPSFALYLQDQRRQSKGKPPVCIKFDLRKAVRRVKINAPPPIDEPEELRIGKDTNAGKVAGAIAEHVRMGIRVQLTGVGADAVCNGITAIAIARKYLAEDGVDLSFQANFNKLEADDGRTINCICLKLLAEQY